jgi:Aspartyl protease
MPHCLVLSWQVIDRSYERAMEDTPEVFGRVCMLYIDTAVSGRPIKAFVDSGAQVRTSNRSTRGNPAPIQRWLQLRVEAVWWPGVRAGCCRLLRCGHAVSRP